MVCSNHEDILHKDTWLLSEVVRIDNIRSVSQRNPTQLLMAEPGGAEVSGPKNIYEIEDIRAKNGGALP